MCVFLSCAVINQPPLCSPAAELESDAAPSPSKPRLSFRELFHSKNIWKNLCVLGFTS